MSHDSVLGITIAAPPAVLAAAAAIAILVIVLCFRTIRTSRSNKARIASWTRAANELEIHLVGDGSEHGPVAQGKVHDHVVTVAPVAEGKRAITTGYSVSYEAPEAPKFRLTKRVQGSNVPIVDTGNRSFDGAVAIETDSPSQLAKFFTAPRRAAVIRMLSNWPSAEITNRATHLSTPSIERRQGVLVDSICHLVATAETFDRPTGTVAANDDAITSPTELVGVSSPTSVVVDQIHGEGDVLTVVRLDELSVIRELFDSGLDEAGITTRFQQQYQGREVTWTGEVVRVGTIDDKGTQRIAALIGSADGQSPNSGRVVAITTLAGDPSLFEGDVATFSGTLANLNADQRLFHLAS